MKDTFCSTYSCRRRQECKRALPVEDLQAVKPFVHIDGYCRGFIPLHENCFEVETSFFKRIFKLNW